MLPYFKKYVIGVCVIAIALPVVASTIWPLVTGQLMAATLGGLALELVLFFGGLFVGYQLFSRRADNVADGFVYLYNVDCQPEAFLTHGKSLAEAITFPCTDQGAWYMGFYAQACLDAGRKDEAARIEEGLRQSIAAQKNSAQRCGVIIALIPLVEKTGTLPQVQELIQEGLKAIEGDARPAAAVQREYLMSHEKVVQARVAQDFSKLVALDESVVQSNAYPMRIRVEFAWDAASASFKLGNTEDEQRLLRFIVDHGGSLMLVNQAKKRLEALSA